MILIESPVFNVEYESKFTTVVDDVHNIIPQYVGPNHTIVLPDQCEIIISNIVTERSTIIPLSVSATLSTTKSMPSVD